MYQYNLHIDPTLCLLISLSLSMRSLLLYVIEAGSLVILFQVGRWVYINNVAVGWNGKIYAACVIL